jgi:LmbE family N-acetylglucosaminyl deacetylase
MAAKRVLLGVFAHPDDESFGPGATLARYAAEGADVHVIIATDGIAGSVEEGTQLDTREQLAQMRAQELTLAAVTLGVRTIWSLPYRDSGMRGSPDNNEPRALIQQPIEELTREVLGYMDRLQPDVVLTHDPYGGYGHPDHIKVCEAVTAAFYLAKTPRKLYYTASDKRILKTMVRIMPLYGMDPTQIGRNKDINLVEISRWKTPVNAKIDIELYQGIKAAASRAHKSQFGGGPAWMRMLPAFVRTRMMKYDYYTRAYPQPNGVEDDLFAPV